MIRGDFETKWSCAVAETFIEDKLNEIVNVRHVVAHKADALNITKTSQNESFKFLIVLAEVLDNKLNNYIKQLLISAKKS